MSETKQLLQESGAQEAGANSSPRTRGPAREKLSRPQKTERWLEISRAIMLGIVALATAWSGYQAARWGGTQSARYAEASAKRVESTRAYTRAGQLSLYDLGLFNQWLNVYSSGNSSLARIYERRFRPEFRPTFDAWLATDPFNNPKAPPGPLMMPEYKVSEEEKGNQLESDASRLFEEGRAANEWADNYVLTTVFLATVLFFLAIDERFDWLPIRLVILVFAVGMLLFGLYRLITLPIM